MYLNTLRNIAYLYFKNKIHGVLYPYSNIKGDIKLKIIVVGASHGGQAAIEEIQTQKNNQVKWFDQGNIADSLRLEAAEAEQKFAELAAKHIQVFSHYQVIHVETKSQRLTVRNLETGQDQVEAYDKLIVATGAAPAKLPIPGIDLSGILMIRDAHSLMQFRHEAENDAIKHVVVVGAGYIGIGAVSLFAQAGKQVTVIDSGERILGSYLDDEFTNVIDQALMQKDVRIQTHERVTEFVGNHNQITAVKTDRATYPADLVIMSIGAKPNTSWLAGAVDLDDTGLVKTNQFQQTSDPNIFAVGDITKIWYTPGQVAMNISLASNARRQGYLAARNLTMPMHAFSGTQGTSAWNVLDYQFGTTGLNQQTAARLNLAIKSSYLEENMGTDLTSRQREKVQFKLIYDPESFKILGAQIMAKSNVSDFINTISLAIQMKMTIVQLADADFFFHPSLGNESNIMLATALQAVETEHLD